MALHHPICPANSPLDVTKVSDERINRFYMFHSMHFYFNFMVIELFCRWAYIAGCPSQGHSTVQYVDSFKSTVECRYNAVQNRKILHI